LPAAAPRAGGGSGGSVGSDGSSGTDRVGSGGSVGSSGTDRVGTDRVGTVRLIGERLRELEPRLWELGCTTTWGNADAQDAEDVLLFDLEHTSALRRALENGVPYCTTFE